MARSINDGFKWKMQREVLEGFLNMCFGKPNLSSGATSGNLQLQSVAMSDFIFTIGGKIFSAPIETSGLPVVGSTGFSNVASAKARLYAICLTSDLSITLWGGAEVSAGSAASLARCGDNVPTSQCIIGTLLISNAATTSWAVGSNVGSTNNVLTDCFMIPQGVIVSE